MHELYVFGYAGAGQFRFISEVESVISAPTCVVREELVEVVWAGWCDLVCMCVRPSSPCHRIRLELFHDIGSERILTTTVHRKFTTTQTRPTHSYTGPSLLPSQTAHLTTSPPATTFFGRPSTTGVLGLINATTTTLTTFSSPEELAHGAPDVQRTGFVTSPWTILGVHFTARDAVFMHVVRRSTGRSSVIEVPNLAHVRRFLAGEPGGCVARCNEDEDVVQVTSNTASLTVLTREGTVYTLSTDPRFTRVAGRDVDAHTHTVLPVPFLAHTRVAKVAAGGLYTVAVASDGELFLWGQAQAGTPGELRCLAHMTEDDDEYVRTVDFGDGARVLDVAVGAGHVLVAVEREGAREVWAAGDNRYGALGLGVEMKRREFVDEFVEVRALRGRRVMQMVCAGMSSCVVVGDG